MRDLKYYAIGEFSRAIGVTIQTLRNWDKNGNLKPHHVGKSGYRYYSQEQLQCYLGLKGQCNGEKRIIGYCRVACEKQKDELSTQVEKVKSYMIARGYSFEIIADIGSGIDYSNKGLNSLIDMVVASEVDKVVILYKDRLVRVCFELVQNLFEKYGTTVEVIDKSGVDADEELVDDLLNLVVQFSSRPPAKAKKLILELLGTLENQSAEG